MGNRLSKIYTRTGDDGSTGLTDGSRVAKDDPRVDAIGTIDELNSAIGILLCSELDETTRSTLTDIQHSLFDFGGELSMPGTGMISSSRVASLEKQLDTMNSELEPLREFILPGGTESSAACHLARTICRRAERSLYSLSRSDDVNPESLRYLNRLSDLLFVMARHLNKAAGITDVFWRHDRSQSS